MGVMLEVDEALLKPENMAAARHALGAKYDWFIHIAPTTQFESIKAHGLQPGPQDCPTNQSVKEALEGKVADVNALIFLRPLGPCVLDSTPRRGESMFALAISCAILPAVVTVDWTFSGTWGLASIIKQEFPTLTKEAIFCDVIRRRGSVAIYESLPAGSLRVRTKFSPPDDPSKWPQLVDTKFHEIAVID